MKTKRFFVLLLALIGLIALQPVFAQSVYKTDLNESTIVWVGRKIAGEHTGNINLGMGELHFDGDRITGGSFEIEMQSITNIDIKKPGNREKLVNHLKSDDFFSVEKFPITRFVVLKATKLEENSYKIIGDLTIKGTTHPVEFRALLHKQMESVHIQAKIVVDRSKYNVRYGSKTFFSNIGDKMIYDDFELMVNMNLKLE